MITKLSVACGVALALAVTIFGAEPERTPVIIDTDIGSEIDDAFSLALAVASPELEIAGITTVAGPTEDRAWLVCRFLTQVGAAPVPVAFGKMQQPASPMDWQIQYRRHPAAIFNRTMKPAKEDAVALIQRLLKERPGKITIVALGPLTNLARLIQKHPEAKPWIRRIVVMGGSLHVGYNGKAPAEAEWNVKTDIAAAKVVFESGVPLTVVPLDVTAGLALGETQRQQIFAARTPLTYQVQNLYELWDKETPVLFDPVAIAAACDDRFLTFQEMRLEIDDKGMTARKEGAFNARVATAIRKADFLNWLVERLRSHGKPIASRKAENRSRIIPQERFPTRVHCWEDYETDIEKRWWMCGKLETKDVPAGSKRACRAVLTQDFDDRMGDTKAMYRAVIFNPVPGPPMGPKTRLRFRYKLTGTDVLRVQLYSLTNGYHRYLSLAALPQGRWAEATVDMAQMRRPDGSGGALAENERIDDIQFYVEPQAELLIDDIVLYESPAAGETHPFPRQIVFSGWFDTGKQGQEWPGSFAIAPHEKPRLWKAAQPVAGPDGKPWLRIGLRGERRLEGAPELFFRYRYSGTEPVTIELVHAAAKKTVATKSVKLAALDWHDTTVALAAESGAKIDEIHFLLPKDANLWLDDLLLYVPPR